jgi:phosphate transport system substrate-binding protein
MFERITARRMALLLAAGALAVTAVACGDDDDSSSSAEPAATSAAAEVSSAVESVASEASSAEAEATSDAESVASEAESAASEDTSGGSAAAPTVTADLGSLSGKVAIDGSSTVEPITSAVAEEFSKQAGGVEVTVGTSGTGGGFEKFCNGETDISDASRPIEDDEKAACADKGVEFVELEIAKDALTVAVNADNDWATCLTTDQLKTIWNEGSEISKWNEVSPDFPDEDLVLYGPDTDSGTFDYFTASINGEEGVSRSDYTASADDNVLVQGVSGDKGGMGYFGFAYYEENQDTLKALEIDRGNGCVAPSAEAVLDGTYTPLSRPLYIYVAKPAAARPEVAAFVNFFLANGASLVEEVGYIPQPAEKYAEDAANFASFAGS